jgi:hypothetical protein
VATIALLLGKVAVVVSGEVGRSADIVMVRGRCLWVRLQSWLIFDLNRNAVQVGF